MTEYVCQDCGREVERSPLCVTCPTCGGPLESPATGSERRETRR